MRDFSWNVFSVTGDIEAYLLYKEYAKVEGQPSSSALESLAENEREELELGTSIL